jgi:DNA-binding CsgD family transcriptional regulator
MPVLVVASVRSDEPGAADVLALCRRDVVREIALSRLPDEAAADLAADCVHGPPLPDQVMRFVVDRAAGLPLLVEEVLTGLIESGALRRDGSSWTVDSDLVASVPSGLRALVTSRLDRLAAAERSVLHAAAVAGETVDWRVLASALAFDDSQVLSGLRAGVDANLLTTADTGARPGELHWRHDLTRAAVLDLLLPPEHALLAKKIADALEASPGGDLARVAALRAASGELTRAIDLFAFLAAEATDRGELGSAADLLDRAAALGHPEAVAALRVRVLTLSGRAPEALDGGAMALPRMSGDAHATLSLELARAAIAVARWDVALAYVERSGRAGEPAADAIAADAAFGAGDIRAARALAEHVVDHPAASPETVCEAAEVIGRCARASDAAEAELWFRRSAQVAAEHGLTLARVRALHAIGSTELARTESSPALSEAREVAENAGMLATVASIDLLLGDAALLTHGPAAGIALAQRSAALAGRLGLVELHATATTLQAFAHAWAGDRAAAQDRLSEVADVVAGVPDLSGAVAAVPAAHALLSGDLDQARDHLDECIAVLSRNRAGAPLYVWGLWACVRSVLGDRDGEAREAVLSSHAAVRTANRAAVVYGDAVAAGRAGDASRAVALMLEADDMLGTAHWWRRMLRLQVWRAAIDDGWGEPVVGLRGDLAVFESAGDELLARISRDLLRQAGVSVRRSRSGTTIAPHLRAVGVTAREAEVLDLVAQGLTNARVASRLFLSTRTVDHHVARLLAKTGSANRAELSRVARSGPFRSTSPDAEG